MFGLFNGTVRLPPELLLMIAKHLTDTDCLAISLSGLFEGFTSLYNRKRNPNSITIDYKYFFLSDPKCWNTFFNQHALSPTSITSFNASNCYWIPAERLCYAVVKIENLEELSIKETQVSLPHLARVFELCPKITKLDFTFCEKNWEEIQDALKKQKNSSESIIQGFKRLTCLKISTSFLDARDYLNDPWLVIIRMLSWCKDCKELTVEITYSGDDFERNNDGSTYSWSRVLPLTPEEKKIKDKVEEDLFPQLDWMVSLKKLVLLKLGNFTTLSEFYYIVRSLLLEDLFGWFDSQGKKLDSLQCLWIQDFRSRNIYGLLPDEAAFTSYYIKDDGMSPETSFSGFSSIEHLGGVNVCHQETNISKKLKYVLGCPASCTDDDEQRSLELQKMLGDFYRNNQEIEYLNVEFMESDYVPSVDFKLPKLKALVFEQEVINKEVVDVFTKLYPNIEFLQLHNKCTRSEIIEERECLSAIRFQNLTSLHLYGLFELHDGAFLIPLIKQCPKLESLHLTGYLEPTSFLKNVDYFLPLAPKLRDLRLEWLQEGDGFPLLLMLKSLLGAAYHLERLALISPCQLVFNQNEADETRDRLVEFASTMKRLVCCCLVFNLLDRKLAKKVQQRIAEEVLPKRPSLWFHLGGDDPLASDPDVPNFHFHEMVNPTFYVPPPNL